MTSPSRQPPVQRFLGVAAPGPFALLGLSPQACSDDAVLASLERQLARVDNHPEGDTPEADEVRLALHAAAAQLLNHAVREQIIARWGDGGSPLPHAPAAPPPPPPSAGTATRTGLEHDAILTLAQYGGWNEQALRRLAMIAASRGLPSAAVAETLRNLGRNGHRAPQSSPRGAPVRTPAPAPIPQRPAAASSAPQPAHAQVRVSHAQAAIQAAAAPGPSPNQPTDDPGDEADAGPSHRPIDPVILIALAFIASVMLITFGAVLIYTRGTGAIAPQPQTTGPTAPQPAAPPPTIPPTAAASTPPTNGAGDPDATSSVPSRQVPKFADAAEAIRALRASVETVREKPDEAGQSFADAVEWISGWWCRLEVGHRRAASDACVEFIYAAARWPDALNRGVDALASGSAPLADPASGLHVSQVWPAAWSAGMLTRLARERDLPAAVAGAIERALNQALGADRPRQDTSFESGAAAALARMPLRILRDAPPPPPVAGPPLPTRRGEGVEAAFKRWSEAIAATLPDPLAQERVLLDGLEQIMVSAPEPDIDRDVYEAIGALAVEIRWRRGGPGRARLVEWFRDQRITSGDLNVLTTAMATASAAEGVTSVMVLPWAADPNQREALRAKFASAWGIAEAAAGDETAIRLAAAAHAAISRSGAAREPTDALLSAAEMATLHHAARRLWRGDRTAAERLIDEAEGLEKQAFSRLGYARSGSLLRPPIHADGQWGLAYLAAGQNRPVRLERLAELERSSSQLGAVDAEVLIEAACFATPPEVRFTAQRVAARYASQPTVVNAMLEMLPKAPRIESVSELIRTLSGRPLPRVSDPDWMLAARRALVERLLEMLAAGGQSGSTDQLANLLAAAYPSPHAYSASSTPEERPPEAVDLADLWSLWRAEAEAFVPNPGAPIPLDRLVSRRAGRATLADGPVQRWAAEHTGLAEMLAYIVTGEQASRAREARRILEALATERRAATHIFTQIMATERAMLRLWLLRYGQLQEAQWSGN